MIKSIKLITLYTTIIFGIIVAYIYFHIQLLKTQAINLISPTLFEVKSGTGLNMLCEQWQKDGLTDSCWSLRILAKLDPKLTDIKAGVYQLTSDSILDNIRRINNSEVHLFSFNIIEGESFLQVLEKLTSLPYIKRVTPEKMEGFYVNALEIKHQNVEGWLFPDTYFYQAGDTDLSLLVRSHTAMKDTLDELWLTREQGLPYSSAYEALIMASIIEKETAKASERPLIASVFINRLHKKMRLQTY